MFEPLFIRRPISDSALKIVNSKTVFWSALESGGGPGEGQIPRVVDRPNLL